MSAEYKTQKLPAELVVKILTDYTRPTAVIRGDTRKYREIIKKHGGKFWARSGNGENDPRWTVTGDRSIRQLIAGLSNPNQADLDAATAADAAFAQKRAQQVPITGNTYPVKDRLKALGCRWNSDNKCWMAPDAETAAKANAIVNQQAAPKQAAPKLPAAASMPEMTVEMAATEAQKYGYKIRPDCPIKRFVCKSKEMPDGSTHRVKDINYVQLRHTAEYYLSADAIDDLDAFNEKPGYRFEWIGIAIQPTEAEKALEAKNGLILKLTLLLARPITGFTEGKLDNPEITIRARSVSNKSITVTEVGNVAIKGDMLHYYKVSDDYDSPYGHYDCLVQSAEKIAEITGLLTAIGCTLSGTKYELSVEKADKTLKIDVIKA
jgi:hypothetical protein